ncbi:unnamed protein product [Sphagnum troendelagicum]|uniref:Uncharacterized protein n=1 Tax=Sphagnum troendelagicum TaxID=128251 RepID=A0ABP0TZI8_9BRYO
MEGLLHHHHNKDQVPLQAGAVDPAAAGVAPAAAGVAPATVVQQDPTKHQKHRKQEAELAGVAAAGYGFKEHHDKKKLEEATGMEKKHHLF